jgi:hypothetical protein
MQLLGVRADCRQGEFYRLASTNPPPVRVYLGQPTQLFTSNP